MYSTLSSSSPSHSIRLMASASSPLSLSKMCKNCARIITWRKKWESNWDSIVYCSSTCKRPLGALDRAFEQGILTLLSARRRAAVGVRKWEMEHVTCEEVEQNVLLQWKALRDEQRAEISDEELEMEGREEEKEEEEEQGEEEEEADRRSRSPTLSNVTHTSSTSTSTSTTTARGGGGASDPTHTRERVRKAARRLTEERIIAIWQLGKIVDPSFAKGVMELRGIEGLDVDLLLVREERKVNVKAKEKGNGKDAAAAVGEEETRRVKGGKGGKKGRKGINEYGEMEQAVNDVEETSSRSNGKIKGGKKGAKR